MSITAPERGGDQRLGSYMWLASTMTLEDLRRETWRLWECEPTGEPHRRAALRLELVELQLELERISLRLPRGHAADLDTALEDHASQLIRLQDQWQTDSTLMPQNWLPPAPEPLEEAAA